MIKETKEVGTHEYLKCYISKFESITDLIKFLSKAETNGMFMYRERNRGLASQRRADDGDDFYDFNSFGEAMRAFEYGTDRYYQGFTQQYNVTKKYIESQLSKKPQGFKKDVIGFLPIVPNVLVGNPVNMINSDIKPHKIPTARILIDRAAAARNSRESITNFSSIIFALVQIMENQGIRCEVWVTDTGCECRECRATILKLKDYMQPLNLYKIQFPIISPDFLRRVVFRLIETDSDITDNDWTDGYGKPMQYGDHDGFEIDQGVIGNGYKKMFDLKDTDVYIPGIDYFNRNGNLDDRIKEIISKTNFARYFDLKEFN